MKVKKVLNNNVVLSENDESQEIVVMGKGVAFQKKQGEEVDISKVEKVFILESKELENLSSLYERLDPKVIEVSNDIIKYAQSTLDVKLSNNIYVTLPDHLSYSIERAKDNLEVSSPLLWEIKKFYQIEYRVGLKALDLLKKEYEVELPESEAASIALHIVNSKQDNQDMNITIRMTEVVKDILNIVSYYFGFTYDEDSFQFTRFITHLQCFSRRLIAGDRKKETDTFLLEQVKEKYPKAYQCTERINKYVKKEFGTGVTADEQLYLMIHIQRTVNEHLE